MPALFQTIMPRRTRFQILGPTLLLLVGVLSQPAVTAPPDCQSVRSYTCHDRRDVTVAGGFFLPGTCLEARVIYACTDPTPNDGCTALKDSSACTEVSRVCGASNYGQCDREDITFECVNENSDMAPAKLLMTEFENYDGPRTSTCDAYQNDPACQLTNTTCVAGTSTRDINGNPVSRPCWQWDQEWTCLGSGTTSTCDVFVKDPSCFQSNTTCLLPGQGGSCLQEEVEYTCGTNQPTNNPACAATNVCIGQTCEGVQDPPNSGFAEAASWLTWLDSLTKDGTLDPSQGLIDVFTGVPRTCRVGAFSVLNCCNDSGWGNGLIGQCTTSEYMLLDANRIGAAIHLGTYCSKSFLWCVQWKRSYCAFNSLLAKVFQVEARKQLGMTFGGSKSPNCRGLTFAEFQALDFTQIDLSPAFNAMIAGSTAPNAQALGHKLLAQMQQKLQAVQTAYGQ